MKNKDEKANYTPHLYEVYNNCIPNFLLLKIYIYFSYLLSRRGDYNLKIKRKEDK